MKILYILRSKADDTVNKIIDVHKTSNEVTIVNINENKNYDAIVDLIASSDKVICW